MSHNAALELCRQALASGFKVTNIYADTVGDPGKYAALLKNGLSQYSSIVKDIVVQPKADRDHKVVSASSICAKVTRDRILKQWVFRENLCILMLIQNLRESWAVATPETPRPKSGFKITKNQYSAIRI
jgi:hypothetical protein